MAIDPTDPQVLAQLNNFLATLDPQNKRYDGYQLVKPVVHVVHHGRPDGFDFLASGLKVELTEPGSLARAFVIEADNTLGDMLKISNGTPVFVVIDKDNVWFLHNAVNTPSVPPVAGASLYVSSDHMRYLDSAGRVWPWPDGNPTPQINNLLAWTFDPALSSIGGHVAEGTVFLQKMYIPRAQAVTAVMFNVTNPANSPTAAYVGLYATDGTRVAVSANSAAVFTTTGVKTVAFTAPYTPFPDYYYTAILVAAGPGLGPDLAYSGALSGMNNINTSGATLRSATGPTGQTTLPASITMSSNVLTATFVWTGLV